MSASASRISPPRAVLARQRTSRSLRSAGAGELGRESLGEAMSKPMAFTQPRQLVDRAAITRSRDEPYFANPRASSTAETTTAEERFPQLHARRNRRS